MKLAVQLVAYKGSADLPELLESLKRQTFADWKLFVYENSCDRVEVGRVQRALEASGIPFHFFISERNTGFDGGHQAMYMMHDAPFVLLINNDAKLESDYFAKVMEAMEHDAKIGSVTGLLYRWTGTSDRVIDTAGLEYHCLGKVLDRFAGEIKSDLQSGEVFGVSGAIGLYRRSAVEAAGGLFDPTWFMYKEDADLALRLRQAGFIAWFEPSAIGWHKRGLKDAKGIVARYLDERRRAPILRLYSYVNQWRMYRRFWKTIGWKDRLCTIKAELVRSAGVFVTSPFVFFRAWCMILFA